MDHFEYYLFSRISHYVEECKSIKQSGGEFKDYSCSFSALEELVSAFGEYVTKYSSGGNFLEEL